MFWLTLCCCYKRNGFLLLHLQQKDPWPTAVKHLCTRGNSNRRVSDQSGRKAPPWPTSNHLFRMERQRVLFGIELLLSTRHRSAKEPHCRRGDRRQSRQKKKNQGHQVDVNSFTSPFCLDVAQNLGTEEAVSGDESNQTSTIVLELQAFISNMKLAQVGETESKADSKTTAQTARLLQKGNNVVGHGEVSIYKDIR